MRWGRKKSWMSILRTDGSIMSRFFTPQPVPLEVPDADNMYASLSVWVRRSWGESHRGTSPSTHDFDMIMRTVSSVDVSDPIEGVL